MRKPLLLTMAALCTSIGFADQFFTVTNHSAFVVQVGAGYQPSVLAPGQSLDQEPVSNFTPIDIFYYKTPTDPVKITFNLNPPSEDFSTTHCGGFSNMSWALALSYGKNTDQYYVCSMSKDQISTFYTVTINNESISLSGDKPNEQYLHDNVMLPINFPTAR